MSKDNQEPGKGQILLYQTDGQGLRFDVDLLAKPRG